MNLPGRVVVALVAFVTLVGVGWIAWRLSTDPVLGGAGF